MIFDKQWVGPTLLFGLAVIILAVVLSPWRHVQAIELPQRGHIRVDFNHPVSIDELQKRVVSSKIDFVSVQGNFSASGTEIQDFVIVTPGENTNDIQSQWGNGRKMI